MNNPLINSIIARGARDTRVDLAALAMDLPRGHAWLDACIACVRPSENIANVEYHDAIHIATQAAQIVRLDALQCGACGEQHAFDRTVLQRTSPELGVWVYGGPLDDVECAECGSANVSAR